ncbi:MAG: minor capsid protein [Mobilitalea sp.]
MSNFGVTNDDHVYLGKLDNKQDKSIGVYQLKKSREPTVSLGGSGTYGVKPISLLVHWTKSARETEKAAYELYELLKKVQNITINDKKIIYIQMLQEEPVDVDMGESRVYERVIEVIIYYER